MHWRGDVYSMKRTSGVTEARGDLAERTKTETEFPPCTGCGTIELSKCHDGKMKIPKTKEEPQAVQVGIKGRSDHKARQG